MSKITIYRFRMYDIIHDEQHVSSRWGTREAIEQLGGEILEDTAMEVEASRVKSEIDGLTERDFNPRPRVQLQQQVMP